MKIAVPSYSGQVDEHFGHCQYFTVYTVNDNKEITHEETVPSPAGCGCKSNIAEILAGMGVSVMLAGNMGGGAVNVLGSYGIDVIRGCSGNTKDVAIGWVNGNIIDNGEECHSHERGENCHNN
ncbi:MAG TPA: NifB/NifX family molybdenum-iron cluster-binding protein [Ignavibacteria bacterium]|nr:NifB/NifX family molybdenum-iron cluster-binding protein [Ignavibacteria bacterium]